MVQDLVEFYEKLVERRQALWIATGKDPTRLDEPSRAFLMMDVDEFINDAHRLPDPFRIMIAQCMEAFLVKYNLDIPLPLKLEAAATPLFEITPDKLTEWQQLLKEQILER